MSSRLGKTARLLRAAKKALAAEEAAGLDAPAVPPPEALDGLDCTELAREYREALRRLEVRAGREAGGRRA